MSPQASYAVDPDPARLPDLIASVPGGTPVVMLNLLRFREVASYDGRPGDCTGREAYTQRYGPGAYEHVLAAGGEVVWSGAARASLIAPAGEDWDQVLLVRYPSIEAFGAMVSDPAYLALATHRSAALLDSRLVAMLPD